MTNTAQREGKTAILRKCRQLARARKQTWVELIILSVILPVMGSNGKYGKQCSGLSKLPEDGN